MRMMWPFLLILASYSAQQCHTLCTYQCDMPVCFADCSPMCLPPACSVCQNVSGTAVCRATNRCWVECPPNQCEALECPACVVHCPVVPSGYWTQCAESECAWRCRPAVNCPKPVCHEQCDPPACEFSGASMTYVSLVTQCAALLLFLATR